MSAACSRLTVYFGERARSGKVPLAEALFACLRDRGVSDAVLVRAGEGFGPRHGLQTSSQLSLSEDLPLVMIAIGGPAAISGAAADARGLLHEGLVTMEGALRCDGAADDTGSEVTGLGRMTVWFGRGARIDGRPAQEALTAAFRRGGADAAVSLLGIDGLVPGGRRRAGFFSANREVPMLLCAAGPRQALRESWSEASGLLPGAFAEISRAEAPGSGGVGPGQDGSAVKVIAYAGGLPPGGGVDFQQRLIRRLRRAGAPGATAFQGTFGFVGDQTAHGESFRALRRRVPVITEIIDSRERCGRWLAELADPAGRQPVAVAQGVEIVSKTGDRA